MPRDETIQDPDWLELAGEQGWAVLMKDDRIRYRKAELVALIAGNVRAFCLTGGNLRADEMAARFLRHQAQIWKACSEPGPLVFAVSVREVRRIDVSRRVGTRLRGVGAARAVGHRRTPPAL